LDPARPIYCAECRPLVLEERKGREGKIKEIMRLPPISDSSESDDLTLSSPTTHKPRVVHSSTEKKPYRSDKPKNSPPIPPPLPPKTSSKISSPIQQSVAPGQRIQFD
ncbi:MAG: hypothetical protein Q8R07_04785, partial [Candidatus Uhrbacteria bacterium]|nr:hypothetical protein [Candidatus Uhrbacteria bacterium]